MSCFHKNINAKSLIFGSNSQHSFFLCLILDQYIYLKDTRVSIQPNQPFLASSSVEAEAYSMGRASVLSAVRPSIRPLAIGTKRLATCLLFEILTSFFQDIFILLRPKNYPKKFLGP